MWIFDFHNSFKRVGLCAWPFSACGCLTLDHFFNNVSTISICTFQSVAPRQKFLDLTLTWIVLYTLASRVSRVCPQWMPDVLGYFLLFPCFLTFVPSVKHSKKLSKSTELSRTRNHYQLCSRKEKLLLKTMKIINFCHFRVLRKLQSLHQEKNYSFIEGNIIQLFGQGTQRELNCSA